MSLINCPVAICKLATSFSDSVLPINAAFWISTLPSRARNSACRKAIGAAFVLAIFPISLASVSVNVLTVVVLSDSVSRFGTAF